MARKIQGICRVCGEFGKLTFEHIPPQCAFNRSALKSYKLDQFWALEAGERARYKSDQRGAGEYALCDECNNKRGGTWYVPEFCLWVQVVAGIIVEHFPEDEEVEFLTVGFRKVRPPRFLKQVVSMLLTINEPKFGEDNPALREFVRDLDARRLPDQHQVYLSIFTGDVARAVGVTPYLGAMGTPAAHTGGVTELSYPPFTYVLTVGSPPLGQAGCRITAFADLPDEEQEVKLRLPVGWRLIPELTCD
jgi:hypothetical protein